MTNEEKEKIIKEAILFQRGIEFDYVSRDMSIKFGRKLKPLEVKDKWIYGNDLDDGMKLKRFLVDGLQELKIIYQDYEAADKRPDEGQNSIGG